LRIRCSSLSIHPAARLQPVECRGSRSRRLDNPFELGLTVAVSVWTHLAVNACGFAATLFLHACTSGPDRPLRPDVLLVTFDTLRADHCSLYGYEHTTTPNLDALASEGVWFETAYAPIATTLPSISSLMTSLHPSRHGVKRNGAILEARNVTLAERLSRAGYATRAVISSIVVAKRFGLGQGFDEYDDDMSKSETMLQLKHFEGEEVPGGKTDRRADATTERALALFDARPRHRPVFLWVHYMDPHEPYLPPTRFGDPFGAKDLPANTLKRAITNYDTEIAFADAQLGRLVAHFEMSSGRDGALVVIGSDHGEGFLDHGWRGHGPQLYEEALRTPLVFRWIGHLRAREPARVPVALLDIVPTLLALLDIEFDPASISGRDLGPTLRGVASEGIDRAIFFERVRYERDGRLEPIPLYEMDRARFGSPLHVRGEKFGVRLGRWKYLEAVDENRPRELYDLAEDPGERLNLVSANPEEADRLAHLLADWRRGFQSDDGDAPAPLSGNDRDALERLGYVQPVNDPQKSAFPTPERQSAP